MSTHQAAIACALERDILVDWLLLPCSAVVPGCGFQHRLGARSLARRRYAAPTRRRGRLRHRSESALQRRTRVCHFLLIRARIAVSHFGGEVIRSHLVPAPGGRRGRWPAPENGGVIPGRRFALPRAGLMQAVGLRLTALRFR